MNEQKTRRLIFSLIAIIVLLLGFLAYVFWLAPSINGYVVNQQISAQKVLVDAIFTALSQQGYVQLTNAEGESVILVPYQAPANQTQ